MMHQYQGWKANAVKHDIVTQEIEHGGGELPKPGLNYLLKP
jgi:hypothetical protein